LPSSDPSSVLSNEEQEYHPCPESYDLTEEDIEEETKDMGMFS
jgi:hypothetical protein